MANNDVFVSYAWKDEAHGRLVDKLEGACRTRGITLKRDISQIRYGESIKAWMDLLGAGRHVILILSELYFKSDYCMYELREIHNHKNFRNRVHPVVLRGTRFSEPAARIQYIQYWEEKKAALTKELGKVDRAYIKNLNAFVDDYADFRRLMDELLNVLADMNSLTEDVHVESDFEAIVNRIGPTSRGALTGRNRKPDDQFLSLIVHRIDATLKQCKPLHDALLAIVAEQAIDGNIASFLHAQGFSTAVSDWLRPATEECLRGLDSSKQEFLAIWETAKTLLIWLSPLSLTEEFISEVERSDRTDGSARLEFAVATKFGVEIASARYRQMEPKFRVEKGKSSVEGAQAIQEPGFETGWSDDHALNTLLLAIWRQIFPEDSRSKLSEDDIRNLDTTFRLREKNKLHHHYVPVALDQQSALTRPEFYDKLMAKLHNLTVIYFKSSSAGPTLRIPDEIEFMTIVREFLTIPEHLSGQR